MTAIDVTAEDIRRGRRQSKEEIERSTCCPIALAARRVYPGLTVSVSGSTICFHFGKRATSRNVYFRGELPNSARKFVDDFDVYGRCAVKPFTFEIV